MEGRSASADRLVLRLSRGGRAEKVAGGYRLSGKWPFSRAVHPARAADHAGVAPVVTAATAGRPSHASSSYRKAIIAPSTTDMRWGLRAPAAKMSPSITFSCPSTAHFPLPTAKARRIPAASQSRRALQARRGSALRFRERRDGARHRARRGRGIHRRERARVATATGRQLADLATMHASPRRRPGRRRRDFDAQGLRGGDAHRRSRQARQHGGEDALAARCRVRGAHKHQGDRHAVRRRRRRGDPRIHPLQRSLRDAHAAQGHIGLNWDANGTMSAASRWASIRISRCSNSDSRSRSAPPSRTCPRE